MLDIFDSTCVLLAKAEQKHYLFTKKLLTESDLGITPGQMTVLYTLYKGDGIPITELGKKIFLDNSTLTGLIDRLEKLELVHRAATPEDRRCYCIFLTDKARQLEPAIRKTMAGVEETMTAGCSAEEVAAFRKVLQSIFAVL
jgi:DNA-binding MarR family transcriptional regulator